MNNSNYKRTIVTSALPYINGIKHLGNFIGSLLPADIYARYLRQKGEDVVFVCGTDEHGAPAEIAAEKEGISVKEYCDRLYQIQKDIYEKFNLSFDFFGRSSSQSNRHLTQYIFTKLYESGHIVERSTVQLYDTLNDRFLPDRFVEGTCPHCGYFPARGDQCDGCTKLLDAIELINPKSAVSGSTELVAKESKQLFLCLPHFEKELKKWINSQNGWPKTTVSIAQKWLQEGLKERCITRDLKWGIPVPLKGYEDKVFYVWFDAPNAYISLTQDWAKEKGDESLWKEYWQNKNSRLVQFLGKDNVPFHTIIWPSIIIGSGREYNLASFIKGFEYLNYEKGKFSTSQKRGIFLDDAIAEFPADYWRYYLVTIIPERSDSDFSWDGFQQSIENLANSLGNFTNRTLTFINRYYGGKIPNKILDRDVDIKLWQTVEELADTCDTELSKCNFQAWVGALREQWATCDRYFSAQAPWDTRNTSPDDAATTLHHAAKLCRVISILSSPLIPESAEQIFRQLNITEKAETLLWKNLFSDFQKGHKISNEIAPLFKKIEDEHIRFLKEKYGNTNNTQ